MTDAQTSTPQTTRQAVVVERTYKATVGELWALWTTKEGFESWWGPVGFRVEVRTLEPQEGGTLHYAMIADTPEMVALMQEWGRPASTDTRSRFSVFQPHERLAVTSVIDFLPGVGAYDSTMRVEFSSVGDHARMVTTLEPMHDEEFTRMARMGYESQLTKLDSRYGWTES